MNGLILILLGAGAAFVHIGNGVVHRFEREAAATIASRLEGERKLVVIRSELGPEALFGEVHRVTIDGAHFQAEHLPLAVEPRRSHRGILDSLALDMHDFVLSGLRVERLYAEIPDCRFDLPAAVNHHEFRLTESGTGPAEAEIGQDDLAVFVRRKYPALAKLKVTIGGDKVILEGRGTLFMAPATFWIAARIEARDGVRLRLVDARMIINGSPVPRESAARLIDLFNPVLDLDRDLDMRGAVRVERVELRDGVMRTTGTVRIPAESPSGARKSSSPIEPGRNEDPREPAQVARPACAPRYPRFAGGSGGPTARDMTA